MIRKLHALHSDLLFVKSSKTQRCIGYLLVWTCFVICITMRLGKSSITHVTLSSRSRYIYFLCIYIKTKNKVFIKIFWFIQMVFTAVEIMETRENKCLFTLSLSLLFFFYLIIKNLWWQLAFVSLGLRTLLNEFIMEYPIWLVITVCCYRESIFIFKA